MDPKSYMYCLIAQDCMDLDAELRNRNVTADRSNSSRSDYCIYRILISELSKLPQDENGPYLGNNEMGWSMYPMADVEKYRNDEKFDDWQSI